MLSNKTSAENQDVARPCWRMSESITPIMRPNVKRRRLREKAGGMVGEVLGGKTQTASCAREKASLGSVQQLGGRSPAFFNLRALAPHVTDERLKVAQDAAIFHAADAVVQNAALIALGGRQDLAEVIVKGRAFNVAQRLSLRVFQGSIFDEKQWLMPEVLNAKHHLWLFCLLVTRSALPLHAWQKKCLADFFRLICNSAFLLVTHESKPLLRAHPGPKRFAVLMEDFKSIVDQYHPMLYKIGRSYAADGDDFDDLYQEMLIQIWQSLKKFRKESRLSTWVYRVAINTALTYKRNQKRKALTLSLGHQQAENVAATQDGTARQREERIELLYEALKSLKKEDRALVLLQLEGKSYEEIADVIGISRTNVGVKLMRLRKKLSVILNQKGYARI